MTHISRLSLLVALLIVLLTAAPTPTTHAQDPTATPPPMETATWTPVPSDTATWTPIPMPTETAADTPTTAPSLTETASPTVSETPSPTDTATLAEITPEVTETVAPSETETATPSETPTGTETTTLLSEPQLGLFFADSFEFDDTQDWSLGAGWEMIPTDLGLGLSLFNSMEPATLLGANLFNVAAQVRVRLDAGVFQLNLRESAAGSYSLKLDSDGGLRLYRSGIELASTFVGVSNGQWRTLRLSAIDGTLRVAVDGVEVTVMADKSPLPSGLVSLVGDSASVFVISDFELYIPMTELLVRSSQSTSMPMTAAADNTAVQPAQIVTGLSRIAFTSTRDVANPNTEIYTINADGSTVLRLTTNTIIDRDPDWSPTDEQLAFETSRDGGPGEIYIMNADGSNPIRLTNNGVYDRQPAWSSEGRIAFVSLRDGNPTGIYVMNADGSNQQRLSPIDVSDNDPAWSPDGTKIVFSSNRDGNPEIYVMNADGSNAQRLTTEASPDYSPAWSPDGMRIAFTSRRAGEAEIFLMNSNGTGVQQITNSPGHNAGPSWSPDGTQIVFQSVRDGNPEIYVVDLQTPCGAGPDPYLVTRLTNHTADDTGPAWSHTGTTPTRGGCQIPPESMDIRAVSLPVPEVAPELLQAADNFFSGDETSNEVANVILPVTIPPGWCTSESTSEARQICAEYGYVAFYALFTEYTGRPPTTWDLLSVVYVHELGLFGQHSDATQALARNFFDIDAGGCRYDRINNTGYDCSYSNLIEWLGDVHSWYARVNPVGDNVIVNLLDLLRPSEIYGIPSDFAVFQRAAILDNIHLTPAEGGIFAYDGYIQGQISVNITAWRTGQSISLPSRWGNQIIQPPGTRNIANFSAYNSSKHFHVLFVHTLIDGRHQVDVYIEGPPPADLPNVVCTEVAVIASSQGGIATSFC